MFRPRSRRAFTGLAFFTTCIVDATYPGTAQTAVAILERHGHELGFPAGQACCESSVPIVVATWCWMSPTAFPQAYCEMIMSSRPPSHTDPLGTRRGVKDPSRSRGTAISMPPGLVAQMRRHLRLQAPLQRAPQQCRHQPAVRCRPDRERRRSSRTASPAHRRPSAAQRVRSPDSHSSDVHQPQSTSCSVHICPPYTNQLTPSVRLLHNWNSEGGRS